MTWGKAAGGQMMLPEGCAIRRRTRPAVVTSQP